MLLGGIARDHSHNDLVPFREGYILEREVVARLSECRSDYVYGAPTEHETKEALGCLVEVAGEHPALSECWFGGS